MDNDPKETSAKSWCSNDVGAGGFFVCDKIKCIRVKRKFNLRYHPHGFFYTILLYLLPAVLNISTCSTPQITPI